MTNTKHKPHLSRPCGIVDETGEPLFYYRDLDAEQREAERQAEARKVTRYRIGSDGKLETRRFESSKWVLAADGWETSEMRARRLHASLLPTLTPIALADVIPLPKPRRYKRDEPICGAKSRKGVPCQAIGIGKADAAAIMEA